MNLKYQLEVVYRMGTLIHAKRDLDTIFSIAANSILQVSRGNRSAIIMVDPETGAPKESFTRSTYEEEERIAFHIS